MKPVAGLGGGDHSSRPAVARRLEHPTRSLGMASVESGTAALRSRLGSFALAIRWDGSPLAAYLGLLAVGFTLPRPSPVARCALTAPFHPYRWKCRKFRNRVRPLSSGVRYSENQTTTAHSVPAPFPLRRCLFCGTFPRLAPGWRYQSPCPTQSGLSSCRQPCHAGDRLRPLRPSRILGFDLDPPCGIRTWRMVKPIETALLEYTPLGGTCPSVGEPLGLSDGGRGDGLSLRGGRCCAGRRCGSRCGCHWAGHA